MRSAPAWRLHLGVWGILPTLHIGSSTTWPIKLMERPLISNRMVATRSRFGGAPTARVEFISFAIFRYVVDHRDCTKMSDERSVRRISVNIRYTTYAVFQQLFFLIWILNIVTKFLFSACLLLLKNIKINIIYILCLGYHLERSAPSTRFFGWCGKGYIGSRS